MGISFHRMNEPDNIHLAYVHIMIELADKSQNSRLASVPFSNLFLYSFSLIQPKMANKLYIYVAQFFLALDITTNTTI